MGKIIITDDTFSAQGEIGYELAGEFARKCGEFIESNKAGAATLDLTAVKELVSPCLTAVYEDCRLSRPAELKVIVHQHLAHLFEPGMIENLYTLEVL
jgi:hypothetical protein